MKSSCGEVKSDDRNAAVPFAASMHSNSSENMDSLTFDYNLHALAEDELDVSNTEYDNEKQSQIEKYEGMNGYLLRRNTRTEKISQPVVPIKTAYESRLHEFIIEGIEDEIDVNDILDDIQPENESTKNIGAYDSDDHFTVNTETPFFHCLNLHWI